LRKLKLRAYVLGEKIENFVDHPMVRPSINALAMTYELANDPKYEGVMTATSHLTGKKINRFTHIHQNVEDLIKKVKVLRLLGQKTGACFQRCVGWDAINALSSVTYEMDQKLGTNYNEKFNKYLRYFQENDLTGVGSMTDVKGDRHLRPSQQADPDLYLHVIKENKDGIVVRGSKAHQTGALGSHEIIVMPTLAMKEEDKSYAVSFAIPNDAEGILHICGRQPSDTRKLEGGEIDVGNVRYGVAGFETLIIFEDVFVPWERVFMCGEYEFTGTLVERFTGYHRQCYGGCRVGVGDVLIGAAATIAEYNGVEGAPHIRDKITEMIHLNETLYSSGIACSAQGSRTPSGTYIVDLMQANVCKQNVTRFIHEICRLAQDIAGGLVVTMPSEKDLRHPEVGKYVDKYLRAKVDVPTEHRMRILRLIENMTLGSLLVEVMHGAGSPQAQRINIFRQAEIEKKKKLAKTLAGIEKG